MRRKINSISSVEIVSIVFLCLFAVFCLYPVLLTIAISFSYEKDVTKEGFKLIPSSFTLNTYRYILTSVGRRLTSGYKISIFITVVGTLLALAVSSGYAYAASVKKFKYRNVLNLFCYIPMIFNAGILPWFILLTKYYHLTNTLSALIFPAAMNLWNVFLIRNYFNSIPVELSESAKIDGAGYWRIFSQIVIPVSRVGLITVGMFYTLAFWNEWYLALMFIRSTSLYPLQYSLYIMLSNAQYLASDSANALLTANEIPPMQTAKMAVTCITIGPIVFVYPFVQRFFVKGIVVGAIKG